MRSILAVALFAAFQGSASAACFGTGDPLFHCTFQKGAKSLDICLQGEVVVYRYGPSDGPAELLMARREIGVGMTPWPGIGRTLWEALTFHNSTFSYEVTYGVDRMPDAEPPTGNVFISEGEKEIAALTCDVGSVEEANFQPVYDAKQAAGQTWCRAEETWKTECSAE